MSWRAYQEPIYYDGHNCVYFVAFFATKRGVLVSPAKIYKQPTLGLDGVE